MESKKGEIIIYQTEDARIDVRLENENIWLTRQQLAVLFGRDYKTISKHINKALKEELAGLVVVAKFANTTQHGAIEGKTQTHELEYFNLEMVTSIGYRVKSPRGVQFRQWHSLYPGRTQAHRRQHARRPHSHDCRKPD